MPQLQRPLPLKQTFSQLAWLAAGLAVVVLARSLLHEP